MKEGECDVSGTQQGEVVVLAGSRGGELKFVKVQVAQEDGLLGISDAV